MMVKYVRSVQPPLGPLPWSLASPDGSTTETNQVVLGKHLKSLISTQDGNIPRSTTVIHRMSIDLETTWNA